MDNMDPKHWVYKAQTRIKHLILGQYLKKWLPILGRDDSQGKPRVLHYVDGFAGRGKYEGGEIGSPIVAMKILTEARNSLNLRTRINITTVELNPNNHAALQQEMDNNPIARSTQNLSIELEHGDFQSKSSEILKRIPKNEMVFVFIDPFGYDCIDMEFIERLLQERIPQNGRIFVELFINAMLQYVARFLSDPMKASTWNRIFGTNEWQSLLGERDERRQLERVVDFYVEQLQKCSQRLGLEAYVFPIGVKAEGSNQELYYLVHVSFNPKGRRAMDEAVATVAEVDIVQLDVFEQQAQADNIKAIIGQFPNITVESLFDKIWLKHPRYRLKAHIDPALKFLEKSGDIEVVTERTRKGGFINEDPLKLR